MTTLQKQITLATAMVLATAVWSHAQTSEGVREFTLSPKTVQTVHGKLGFTSVIVLPPDEPIAETVIGDTTGWSVEDSGNVIKITMLKAGPVPTGAGCTPTSRATRSGLVPGPLRSVSRLATMPLSSMSTAIRTGSPSSTRMGEH